MPRSRAAGMMLWVVPGAGQRHITHPLMRVRIKAFCVTGGNFLETENCTQA